MSRDTATGPAAPNAFGTSAGTGEAAPAAEVDIDAALVRELLRAQHPRFAGLPLAAVDAGWDNAMFRLGDALAVRLPRRAVAAPLIVHEQTWLPRLAAALPLPIPAPVAVGAAGGRYPWRWSVVPWLAGQAADLEPPAATEADVLTRFLRSLHVTPPPDAPSNPYRGVPLHERREIVAARLERLTPQLEDIAPALAEIWRQALEAAPAPQPCWIHGDLHARNILVRGGRLSAVIDWGDLCAGDPATDLAAVWMVLDDARARRRVLDRYGADADLERRARGWAVSFGAVLLETGLANYPRHVPMGRATLQRLADEPLP